MPKRTPSPWALAVQKARKELGIIGFQLIKKDSDLYRLAMKYYKS